MAAVTTLYHLTNKEGSMNKALERISSGLRLNHAVDDAAGASIVNRMTSQIKGLEAAIRNAADAISLTQTAEGSLEEVTQILHRMRELSVQAANGVYTGQDRQAINNEIVAMQNELQRIAESSTFNGVKMLNGDFQDTTFQVGFQPNDTATLSIEDVRPSGLGEYILSTSNIDASTVATAAKFEISQTGVIKSKAKIDFDTPGSAASSNRYDITILTLMEQTLCLRQST
jgi:flagellin